MKTIQGSIPEKIIEGSMVVIGLAEIAHLYALFLKKPFHVCVQVMAVLFVCALCSVPVYVFLRAHKKKKNPMKPGERNLTGERRFLKLLRVYPFLFLGIGLLIILQIIWNDWMHVPYLKNNIMGEMVQSMLFSDTLYDVNPMTGQPFTEGMPLRLQILALPTLLAVICKLTGIPVQLLVYNIVPMIVLLLSYLVYSRFAVFFFPNEGKKQAMFMLFTVLVYQFGCYGPAMDSFLLFFCGSTGAAFRAGVILPYALLCCLQNKWRSVILCALAEICVVWTLYGLGYTVIIAVLVLCIRLVRTAFDRRKKA